MDKYADGEYNYRPGSCGLYDPGHERDACGLAIVADLKAGASHSVVRDALEALRNLEHRGAVGGDRKTGDGAGLLCRIPAGFFSREMGLGVETVRRCGIGMFFLPSWPDNFSKAKALIGDVAAQEGFSMAGWREVPVRPQVLGQKAARSMPRICQAAFLPRGLEAGAPPEGTFPDGSLPDGEALERKLYVLRRRMENGARSLGFDMDRFYVPSLSSRTIVYKGMFVASQFAAFYPDLEDPEFKSSFAIVHQRYSTNTFPSWPLAQPFRMISHNGEINTLRKNVNAMKARQATMSSAVFGTDFPKLFPVVEEGGSDSAMFDNVFELLTKAGRRPEHAFMMMVPEPYSPDFDISRDKRAFYEYHATIMEGWDGPAAMTFTDGITVGAALDRNGLRPFRYVLGRNGRFVGASEAGVLEMKESEIAEKGMLRPGTMVMLDMSKGSFLRDREIKARVCRQKPYRRWLESSRIELKGLFSSPEAGTGGLSFKGDQRAARFFGLDKEALEALEPMFLAAQEGVSAMGSRKPPAALVSAAAAFPAADATAPASAAAAPVPAAAAPLAAFFKQRFAQVTNPPIDPYRETLVMSLQNYVGRQRNLLDQGPEHCRQLRLDMPLLSNADMERLRSPALKDFSVGTVSMCCSARELTPGFAEKALERMKAEAERLIDQGASLVVLSDRDLGPEQAALPSLLAASVLHSHLVEARKRHMAGLIVEAGDAKDLHSIALLLAYGASGVNPWAVFESIPGFAASAKAIDKTAGKAVGKDSGNDGGKGGGKGASLSEEKIAENFREAVRKGILKIMSKLGISTISSYRGSRMYEAEGLSPEFASACFKGTETRFGGIGLGEIEQDIARRHSLAFGSIPSEPADAGNTAAAVKAEEDWRAGEAVKAGEASPPQVPWPPALASSLVRAVREGDMEAWRDYVGGIESPRRQPFAFRDLFAFKPREPVPLKEVQSAQEIARRFSVAAMSCGAISPEAHEALAAGANSIGSWSDSGEGGEDNLRKSYAAQGLDSKSASRQVASARFGVTDEYLASALEIQIKVAQGAKPGEGGQLPGPKVDAYIAALRHSSPGKTLISPPPHHDIYSIEDLSQLIHDLRCVNPKARIAVKLAAQAGIGAVAAGVAKAGADCIVVSSGDGGTGAAPLSSLDFAGSSWEAALPEIRQVLAMNGLDAQVTIQVDGRLRTARDVAVAAILGAREFAFGTAALISMGCVACGKCNLDRCPVGIATQNPALREKFKGKPEHLASFFLALAHDLRILLSSLGARNLDELAGRWDLLDFQGRGRSGAERGLAFDSIVSALEIAKRYPLDEEGNTDGAALPVLPLPPVGLRAFHAASKAQAKVPEIDGRIIAFLDGAGEEPLEFPIRNSDRSIGAAASGHLARRRRDGGTGTRHSVRFRGSAGQSFGAFLAKELCFELEGEANDYVGKGLSGGILVLRPSREAGYPAQDNAIAGNVCLFGATSGWAYMNGQAGERFCVRNSGAIAVVEGVGNHACEYMTGGTVVVLGPTGVNFGAGMSDGRAYVLDEDGLFDTRCNSADLDLSPCLEPQDESELKSLVENHAALTGSPKAARILAAWDEYLPRFVIARPRA